ncbi:diaminobutyrate--2-oxoglutarate transaminase [Denitrobaculum tricleocarpae]|uniref:Diaminobutyrate--2-oxoglutarate transaminase n=1 Tax=Denitrobaculum tricleocarpae TaxID=2591009 RepID=A0A545U1F9_9PROT|nr:diaminobutyrate--2-oxoglutarate transaminase [Denitrobaculum tricleocarpae]TQV83311.1 diaminobutyrate--2-oxoglutarate transaminase [Denitrobaculum tricleocarpae]
MADISDFQESESEVRVYCRSYPTVFTTGKEHTLSDEDGNEYIDFLSGAGALNYGHNNELLQKILQDYISANGVTMSLDLFTSAKRDFISKFNSTILAPRSMHYKMQFVGPTGTNSVEAALKLARKVTGRFNVVAFTNGFHGVTLGALAATANKKHREATIGALGNVTRFPFDGYFGHNMDSLIYAEGLLSGKGSGIEPPAAILLETIQGEGGINVASGDWLRGLQRLCREVGALLIVDDIQMGCGRTGTFFSFEEHGLDPDVICLSKSISGYGLPMALTLLKPKLDIWRPGEHNGTFRGNNLAFVTASAALDYWRSSEFSDSIVKKGRIIRDSLERTAEKIPLQWVKEIRGKGMVFGFELNAPELAETVVKTAFKSGLIIETCGADDNVLKVMPPLTISEAGLMKGLDILHSSIVKACSIH